MVVQRIAKWNGKDIPANFIHQMVRSSFLGSVNKISKIFQYHLLNGEIFVFGLCGKYSKIYQFHPPHGEIFLGSVDNISQIFQFRPSHGEILIFWATDNISKMAKLLERFPRGKNLILKNPVKTKSLARPRKLPKRIEKLAAGRPRNIFIQWFIIYHS